MGEDGPSDIELALEGVQEALRNLGDAVGHMSALYGVAIATADAVQAELRRRGQPTEHAPDRVKLEYTMLLQWLQLTEQFASQFLGLTVQQAAQIGRLPSGPRIVDARELRGGPDRGRLR